MFVVIDIRDMEIRWSGSKKDCKEWISMTNPMNRKYYKIVKIEEYEKGVVESL